MGTKLINLSDVFVEKKKSKTLTVTLILSYIVFGNFPTDSSHRRSQLYIDFAPTRFVWNFR